MCLARNKIIEKLAEENPKILFFKRKFHASVQTLVWWREITFFFKKILLIYFFKKKSYFSSVKWEIVTF